MTAAGRRSVRGTLIGMTLTDYRVRMDRIKAEVD